MVEEIDPKGDVLLHFPATGVARNEPGGTGNFPSKGLRPASVFSEPWRSESLGIGDSLPSAPTPATDDGFGQIPLSAPGWEPEPQRDRVSIRVSSSVLSLISPVFATMFSSPFSEGEAFRAPDSPRPFPITLPEDDGRIFSVMAKVMHHRSDAIPFLPSTTALIALAAVVDKYAAQAAMMPYAVVWLQRATERRDDPEYAELFGRCNLLLFAYILDLPVQFAALSWDVILMHRQTLKDETESGLELPIPPGHDLLRHDLHGELARRKARLRQKVHAALMEPIKRVTDQLSFSLPTTPPPPPSPYHNNTSVLPVGSTCPNAALAIGNYVALLESQNLSPWRAQYETDAFHTIIRRAIDVAQRYGSGRGGDGAAADPLWFEQCTRFRCACRDMQYASWVQMADQLAAALQGAWNWKLWACLDCLKSGGESRYAGGGAGSGEGGEKTGGVGGGCRLKHW